ncbi:MAG: flagellar hook-basal body complex protein FliE [Planctomycetes bacterium RBG_13_60_9]|nr:MAG: flagellar hook-basal body complex protein FliE [Planctomycetes bacterium RBG_13_60_9]
MIDFDPNVSSTLAGIKPGMPQPASPGPSKVDFSQAVKAVGAYVSKIDDLQQASDTSVQDLLTGKNNDITTVVSAVAKADLSFNVLVGVRNKLIEAYKQTMNMPL